MYFFRQNTRIRPIFGLILFFGFVAAFSCTASAEVLKVVVNDTIQPISDEYIGRAIEQARQTTQAKQTPDPIW